jgi:hypothetical protein
MQAGGFVSVSSGTQSPILVDIAPREDKLKQI